MLEPTKKENKFISSVKSALINNSPEEFETAYDSYKEYLSQDTSLTGNDKILKLNKSFAKVFFEFVHSRNFDENKVLDYLGVVESTVNPKFISFLLWTQDKRNACFTIFENNEFHFTEAEYEAFYVVFAPSQYNPNVPFSAGKRQVYLTKQKNEFLFHQDRYKLLQELSKIPEKTIQEQPKKPKI